MQYLQYLQYLQCLLCCHRAIIPSILRRPQASQLHIDRDAEIARRLQEAGSPGHAEGGGGGGGQRGSLMSPQMIAQQMEALQHLEAARVN